MPDPPSLSLWHQLVAVSLVGTERQDWQPSPTDGALGSLLDQISGREPEVRLLASAAALSLYQRAGRRPERSAVSPDPEPCPPDRRPRCSPAAARHLRMMLDGQHREALPEWLDALDRSGQRAPEEAAPDLLDRAKDDLSLRSAVLAALGDRAVWLARQNAEWSFAIAAETDAGLWQTGTREERLAVLRRIRAEDPDRARELIGSTWAAERPDDRAVFLHALLDRLSPADEPLLETALDDRRKEVRVVAATLLARLRGSGLVRRMLERTQPLLRWVEAKESGWSLVRNIRTALGGACRGRLEVALPEACDKGMVRDGIEPRPVFGSGTGEKAWWLQQMVAIVSPSIWCETWRASPEEILQAAWSTEFAAVLTRGWARAAERHRSIEWAEPLLDAWWRGDAVIENARDLLGMLEPGRREAFLVGWMRQGGAVRRQVGLAALHQGGGSPWGPELSREVLVLARETLQSPGTGDADGLPPSRDLARLLSPSVIEEATAGWPTDSPAWPAWARAVEAMLDLLRFRAEMLKELTP